MVDEVQLTEKMASEGVTSTPALSTLKDSPMISPSHKGRGGGGGGRNG